MHAPVSIERVAPKGRTGSCRAGEIYQGSAGVAQSVEHLFCKQAVSGSSPLASSSAGIVRIVSEGCPSGQGAGCKPAGSRLRWFESNTLHKHPLRDSSRRGPCGSSSVGRASAFQAERRGFESHLPLRSELCVGAPQGAQTGRGFEPAVCGRGFPALLGPSGLRCSEPSGSSPSAPRGVLRFRPEPRGRSESHLRRADAVSTTCKGQPDDGCETSRFVSECFWIRCGA